MLVLSAAGAHRLSPSTNTSRQPYALATSAADGNCTEVEATPDRVSQWVIEALSMRSRFSRLDGCRRGLSPIPI